MMFEWFQHNLSLYLDYIRRLRYSDTHFERHKTGSFREYSDYILFTLKKYTLGTLLYAKAILSHPELFNPQKDYSDANERRDAILLHSLVAERLFLFPAHSFYPSMAKITITTRCNYRCDHCFQDGERHEKVVSVEDVESFMSKLQRMNIRELTIMGGEPFLEPEVVFSIITCARKHGVDVRTITTNGFWCQTRQKVEDYLQALHKLRYRGNICISVGRGHEQYQQLEWFAPLKEISRRIVGRNIFFFTVEETSMERFDSRIKVLRRKLGNYNFRPMIIVQVGGGVRFRKESQKGRIEERQLGRCCGTGVHLLPDGGLTFCLGPASLLPQYRMDWRSPDYQGSGAHMLEIPSSIPALLASRRGEDVTQGLRAIGADTQVHPTFCDVCVYLSKHPETLSELNGRLGLVGGKGA